MHIGEFATTYGTSMRYPTASGEGLCDIWSDSGVLLLIRFLEYSTSTKTLLGLRRVPKFILKGPTETSLGELLTFLLVSDVRWR